MPWYKVTLPYEQSVPNGEAIVLQKSFELMFMSNASPKDAAMFTNQDEDFVNCQYYFSPGTVAFFSATIERYGGAPCPPPKRAEVKLIVGHAGAREALLPETGNS